MISHLLISTVLAERERQIEEALVRRTGRRRKRPLTRIPAYREVRP